MNHGTPGRQRRTVPRVVSQQVLAHQLAEQKRGDNRDRQDRGDYHDEIRGLHVRTL